MASRALREEVLEANLSLVSEGLVRLSFGNASGVDRDEGIFVIKPSGVPYAELRADDLVAVSIESGEATEGELRPSSDTPTHLHLYRSFPDVGGVVHTHSQAAAAWAQAGLPIPPFGTTHADHFHGPVPVTRQLTQTEVDGEYEKETGVVIVETLAQLGLSALEMPGILVASHGPFTWGKNATDAAKNATVLELVAAIAAQTLALNPETPPILEYLMERHYQRKHGPAAYYGQPRR
jgi:L-ribulose-5-phosphate 4-epimerase